MKIKERVERDGAISNFRQKLKVSKDEAEREAQSDRFFRNRLPVRFPGFKAGENQISVSKAGFGVGVCFLQAMLA